ncbi:MAG TPA: hypothetical protein VFB72_07755, partial [Verrucomicrobiae bacterium]|nr:hypothetical protein [Verrucomicrobiae bacterium]
LFHIWETAPNSPTNWSSWAGFASGSNLGCTRVAVANQGPGGDPIVFYMGSGNSVSYFAYNGGWPSSGTSIGGNVDTLCVGMDADGGLEVFGTGTDRAVWHNYQQGGPTGSWSGWSTLHGNLE